MVATHVITPSEEDARWRFTDDPRGEVEHLTLMVHGEAGDGFWLSISALRADAGRPRSVVCADALLFTGGGEIHAARAEWPSAAAQFARDLFFLKVGDLQLDQASSRGSLPGVDGDRELSWDLRWRPAAEGHRPLPGWSCGPRSGVLTPQVDLEVHGRLSVGGREISLDPGRGSLHHVWGRRQPEAWIRAWGGHWEGAPDLWFQAMTVRMNPHPLSPRRTTLYTRMRGERTRLGGTLWSARYESELDETTWRFSGSRGDRRIEGWVQGSPDQMVGVDQKDPDGRIVHRLVAGCAQARVTLLEKTPRGWVPMNEGHSDRSVLLEIGYRGRHRTLGRWLR